MSKSRDNHYVPKWYQKGFIEPNRSSLVYLDLTPDIKILPNGRKITPKSFFPDAPVSRCFYQTDLYSTFFLGEVNDEIEKKLFGDIDTKGAKAVRAFCTNDKHQWHQNFETLFKYIDTQKIRTPKGLDWLRQQYPYMNQNQLMYEMQAIQMMHCSIWSEGVREIVSAEKAGVKFILSDHPVTVYNHGLPLKDTQLKYPHDPSITLKASQTIFPLNRDFCLILTNLEYAEEADCDPLKKRTFSRHFKNSMVRTDAFIKLRYLGDEDVMAINSIIKSRAKRYIAAGEENWLYPEKHISRPWSEFRHSLRPPVDGLMLFGGEIYAKFDNGRVHYQDAYGRTEKERDFLQKPKVTKPLKPNDYCGCGSGKSYKDCCKGKPVNLRPSWSELSIRERNIHLMNGIGNILQINETKDWLTVRKELTNESVSEVYSLFDALWPLETDIFALLPKPDGEPRAVYTGIMHPEYIIEFALGASLYFGEIIIQHPFMHPKCVSKEFNPIEKPEQFRLEFLKSVLSFITIMPLVEIGVVNLVPDPCFFDHHLQRQTLHIAKERSKHLNLKVQDDPRSMKLIEDFHKMTQLMLPNSTLLKKISNHSGEMSEAKRGLTLAYIQRLKESYPLLDLNNEGFQNQGGQMNLFQLAPNFEIAMYLAQAIGGCIITDSPHRWKEIQSAAVYSRLIAMDKLNDLKVAIETNRFSFPPDPTVYDQLKSEFACKDYYGIMSKSFKYLQFVHERGAKPNLENSLAAKFKRSHTKAQKYFKKNNMPIKAGKIECLFPTLGIQDHTINRLLLMSACEHYLPHVPMAFLLKPYAPSKI